MKTTSLLLVSFLLPSWRTAAAPPGPPRGELTLPEGARVSVVGTPGRPVEAAVDGGLVRTLAGPFPPLSAGSHWLTLRAAGGDAAARWIRLRTGAGGVSREALPGGASRLRISIDVHPVDGLPGVTLAAWSAPEGGTISLARGDELVVSGMGAIVSAQLGPTRLGPAREITVYFRTPGKQTLHVEARPTAGEPLTADFEVSVAAAREAGGR